MTPPFLQELFEAYQRMRRTPLDKTYIFFLIEAWCDQLCFMVLLLDNHNLDLLYHFDYTQRVPLAAVCILGISEAKL